MKRIMMRALALLPLLALTGCIGGQQGTGFDVNSFLKNPVVMVIIGIVVLIFVFKDSKH